MEILVGNHAVKEPKVFLNADPPVSEGSKLLSYAIERCRIHVQGTNRSIWSRCVQERFRMGSATECPIEISSSSVWLEALYDLVGHHCGV
jgi:hypothetical protein